MSAQVATAISVPAFFEPQTFGSRTFTHDEQHAAIALALLSVGNYGWTIREQPAVNSAVQVQSGDDHETPLAVPYSPELTPRLSSSPPVSEPDSPLPRLRARSTLRAPSKRSPSTRDGRVRRAASEAQEQEKRATIRAHMKAEAKAIQSVPRSQATRYQLFIMGWVYKEITPYPDETWRAMVAIAIKQSFDKVSHWFSNQRQNAARERAQGLSQPPDLLGVDVDGRLLRLHRHAIAGPRWTDVRFQTALDELVEGQKQKSQARIAVARGASMN